MRSSPKQWVQNLQSYKHFGTAHGFNKLLVLDSKQTSRHVNFAERHVNSKAISRRPLAVPQADRPFDSDIATGPQAFPTRRRDCKTSPRGPAFRPRHANFDDAALLANKGRCQRQTTTRRNKTLARAEMGSSAKTKTTARASKRKAGPVGGLGRKESASGGSIHESASSSACKASKAATARRVLVARAYRYYIQRRQLFSERQE